MTAGKKDVCAVGGWDRNGAAFARRFAAEGYAVALLARSTDTTRDLAATLPGSRAYACDVGDAASVARAFEASKTNRSSIASHRHIATMASCHPEWLVTVIGRKSDNGSTRHLLRQYMLVLREILLANKAPFVIATVQDVGYALCEIADPRHTSRTRRSNGVSRLAKTVRHWRIAAGLTQNCRCEAIWHEPLLSQPFGKWPPQPHTCYARTPGENS